MGLRFPISRFITSFFQHIKVSPSQMAPNSYSFLLALAVLLSYYNIPLIPYVLMQLIQIKRLGPGNFYLSHKGNHTFIKGNPSSHKGWMSRFFYVKRVGRKRNPWRCDMYWRDNMYILTSLTPEWFPNLATFLVDMREKSYNAPELVKEDLMCHFGFSRKGVELVGDLSITASSLSRVITCYIKTYVVPELVSNACFSIAAERMGKTTLLRAMREDVEKGSSGAAAPPVKGEMVWGGEVIKRLTQYQREVNSTRQSFDEVMEHHTELEMQLEEVEATRAQDKRAAEAKKEALEAQLASEKAARAAEKEAFVGEKMELEAEIEATSAKRIAIEGKLVETKARAEEEVGHLRSEVAYAWGLGKEEFLKSSEFDDLCAKKSLAYFKICFASCVAQFRVNDYSKEEHPTPFHSVTWALEELSDDDEKADEEDEDEDDEGANPSSSPKQ
ncbi:hypothetical protein F511_42846 [Dorcoceras hygrometricum]|uniref:Uncharacterized protein n=1 Tax=Dorcoceras hygrometricum TaxID=472368 RepID=A0A2Z6ZZ54_9LAMI|nr:hypothetical protein F511_42846 [Dorcoceras hygrometricum]